MGWVGVELHGFLGHFLTSVALEESTTTKLHIHVSQQERRELENSKGSGKIEIIEIIPFIEWCFGATINLIFLICN